MCDQRVKLWRCSQTANIHYMSLLRSTPVGLKSKWSMTDRLLATNGCYRCFHLILRYSQRSEFGVSMPFDHEDVLRLVGDGDNHFVSQPMFYFHKKVCTCGNFLQNLLIVKVSSIMDDHAQLRLLGNHSSPMYAAPSRTRVDSSNSFVVFVCMCFVVFLVQPRRICIASCCSDHRLD